jgi:hypothetical protein
MKICRYNHSEVWADPGVIMGTLRWTVNGYTIQKYGLDQQLPGSYLPVTVKYTVRKN